MIYRINTQSAVIFKWVYILLMPALIFPAMSVIALLFDWLIGDSGTVLQILHGSKRQFLYDYLNDWKASLPLTMTISWLVFMPLYISIQKKLSTKALHVFVLSLMVWVAVGLYLFHFRPVSVLLFVVSGLIIQSILFVFEDFSRTA